MKILMEPHREIRDIRINAVVGRHPDHKIAHSSMAKAEDLSCREKNIMDGGGSPWKRKK